VELESVVVRRATPDDAAAISAILNAAIADGRHSLLDTPFSVAEERRYIAGFPAGGVLVVAELPGAGVVGFQSLEPYASFGTHAFDHVLTMGTYVDGSYRRCGIGRLLARHSLEAARLASCTRVLTEIRADNDVSLCFYSALGFTVVGVAHELAHLGGRLVDVVFVERRL
jgi:L-amino acid N-acyltransferase YncA